MKIVLTGGGSGGHITPILAVAHELKRLQPDVHLIYIGQKGDHFAAMVGEQPVIDQVFAVRAGKFRRYHGEGLKQLLDVPTLAKNVRDAWYVLVGLWQSFWLLGRLKPDTIFTRGGFVSVPVALAGRIRRVPYITHDSDAVPSLANRLIAHGAALHAVALPIELYPYPAAKTVNVGVPVARQFQPVGIKEQQAFKRELGLARSQQVVLITGGGLGAAVINQACLEVVPKLLAANPQVCVIHTVGQQHEAAMRASYERVLAPDLYRRLQIYAFVPDLYRYSASADVIIARGGATTLAEFARQGKACIVIPNPLLTGGHQTKNAEAYAAAGAVMVVRETELHDSARVLVDKVTYLLQHKAERQILAATLQKFARPDSARELAAILLRLAAGKESKGHARRQA